VARTDWLRHTGGTYREMEAAGIQLPVIEAHCDYRRPARYDDDLDIRTRATRLSPVRIRFDYELTRYGGDVLATGHTVHAAVDRGGRPCRLPADVLALLDAAAPPAAGPDPDRGSG